MKLTKRAITAIGSSYGIIIPMQYFKDEFMDKDKLYDIQITESKEVKPNDKDDKTDKPQ
jgi:hypothetical protein